MKHTQEQFPKNKYRPNLLVMCRQYQERNQIKTLYNLCETFFLKANSSASKISATHIVTVYTMHHF